MISVPFKFPEVKEDTIEEYIEFCEKIFPKNSIKIQRTKIPTSFIDDTQKKIWEEEEINRCINGYGIMNGPMYFYFNYCRIKSLEGGIIRPLFRVSDNAWFETVLSCFVGGGNSGLGVVTVKRRRAGFTWKAASLMLWKAIFFTGSRIGFDSKTEADSFKMMKDFVQFIYDGLPKFLQASVDGGKNKANMTFSVKTTDSSGNSFLTGALSELYCKAPVDEAHEGEMLHIWLSDEAGKKPNLLSMWSLTLPCMEQEGRRLGVPILFGTAGDVDKGSYGLNELWKRHKAYGLIPFFFAGWMGMKCDEFGNDNVREAVMEIMRIRKAKATSQSKDLFDYIQQYPLTPTEALKVSEVKGIGHEDNIEKRKEELAENPPYYEIGRFRWGLPAKGESEVVWEKIDFTDKRLMKHDFLYGIMWKKPIEGEVYDAGCDPADHDYVQKKASKMAMYIINRNTTDKKKPYIPFKLVGRPKLAPDYYEQSVMALMYYNHTQVLIENNRYGMISYYKQNGYEFLLKFEPVPIHKLKRGVPRTIGVRKGANVDELERCINDYTENHCDLINDESLLEEFGKYGEENTDQVIAFGWTLISLQDSLQYATISNDISPDSMKSRLVRDSNGKIKRVFTR